MRKRAYIWQKKYPMYDGECSGPSAKQSQKRQNALYNSLVKYMPNKLLQSRIRKSSIEKYLKRPSIKRT